MNAKDEEELARSLYERRNEPGEWSEEPVQIDVRGATNHMFSFRLSLEELEALQRAAAEAGEKVSEYIRGALAIRIHGHLAAPSVEITSGLGQLFVRSEVPGGGRNEGNPSFVAEFPPDYITD